MYYKVINETDVNQLMIEVQQKNLSGLNEYSEEDRIAFLEAIVEFKNSVQILDQEYGSQRHPDDDLGGISYVLPTCHDYEIEYSKIIQYHHMSELPYEYEDVVARGNTVEFVLTLYLLSSDYAIILLYPRGITNEEDV